MERQRKKTKHNLQDDLYFHHRFDRLTGKDRLNIRTPKNKLVCKLKLAINKIFVITPNHRNLTKNCKYAIIKGNILTK